MPRVFLPAVATLLGMLAASSARADCASGAVWAWPAPAAALDPAGRVVLEAYGTDQAWVLDVARLSPRLVSGSDTVPLRVVESHRGSFEVAQVVLEAERPLRAGRTYRLALTGRPAPTIWTGEKHAPLEWGVAAGASSPPRFRSAPRLDRTSFTAFGCGPAIYAHVAVDVDQPRRVQFRVWVEPTAAGPAVEYLVPAENGSLDIGHGMCSGPFTLTAGSSYRVTIAAVDAAGHETPAPGGPIAVVGPSP